MSDAAGTEATYLSLWLRANELLGRTLDYHETIQNVCDLAVEAAADLCIVDIGTPGNTELVGAAHHDRSRVPELAQAGIHLESVGDRPIHPVCEVLKTGETFYAPRIDNAWIDAHATRPEHAEFMRRMHYTSMIVVPLVSQVFGLTGALTVVSTRDNKRFDAGDVTFAEGLGRLCSTAIGKARLYDEARGIATSFQKAALPRIFPHPSGVEFFAYYQPATTGLMLGGDWYDAFPLPDGRIGISVGDASGHGLAAGVLMASLRHALRAALVMEPNIGGALDAVDYLLRTEYEDAAFATALLAVIDPDAMTLRLGSAGHPGPKIWDPRKNAVMDPFVDRDLPLGLRDLSEVRAKPKSVRLDGGLAVFYTDGLVESDRDILEGERALADAIARADVRDAADPALAIREAMGTSETAIDDIAILAVRFDVATSQESTGA